MDATPEEWRPVVGWEGLYEVSDQGRVRSLDRTSIRRNRWGLTYSARYSGKVLALRPDLAGRMRVTLSSRDGSRECRVHQLVLAAFVGPRPEGMMVLHWDDNPANNHLSNLRYGTQSENMRDSVRNGTHHLARKTHCIRGHEFTPGNTVPHNGSRNCRECRRKKHRELMRAKRAEGRIAKQATEVA